MHRLAMLVGMVIAALTIAFVAAITCAWSRESGPGPCRFIGPDSGPCHCPGFVRSGDADGNCRSCFHPRWVHAGD